MWPEPDGEGVEGGDEGLGGFDGGGAVLGEFFAHLLWQAAFGDVGQEVFHQLHGAEYGVVRLPPRQLEQ